MSKINQIKILVADDEAEVLKTTKSCLESENYIVLSAMNGNDAFSIARKENPQIIILDISMPGVDGIEVCRHIREFTEYNKTIIIFLTNRKEDYSQIAAFEAGADDYIIKPVNPEILLSRIKAFLKRNNEEPKMIISIFGDLKIDREKFLIILKNKKIELPRKEFELLEFLTSRPGKVFSRDEILKTLWSGDFMVIPRTIDVHISKIRESIGMKYIRTVKGVGYKFEF